MDDIFSDLVARMDGAIAEVVDLAVEVGVPITTYEPILTGVKKRAGQ